MSTGTNNGIQAHYNVRADKDLGTGSVAVRRIPCTCSECLKQLDIAWNTKKDKYEQSRYKENKKFMYWNVFEGLNNWQILDCLMTKKSDEQEIDEVHEMILDNYADVMAETL